MSTSPVSRPSESGSSRPILILLLAVVMFASGAATSWWWFTQRVPPKTTVASVPVASASPNFGPLTPSPVTASASPAALPSVAPSAAEPSPRVAEVAPPPASLPAPRPRVARSPRMPPATTPPVTAPGAPSPVPPSPAGRGFVLGTTVVESRRAPGKDLSGFDTADVGVKRAPKVEGLIELVMDPPQVKAGEAYAVKVFLKNQGRKPIDVGEMKVSVTVDGKTTTRPLPPKARQVAPMQRALLEELPGVWRGDVSDWAMEAVVTSKQQDVYRNTLTWK